MSLGNVVPLLFFVGIVLLWAWASPKTGVG
jgi:hypothetical protein